MMFCDKTHVNHLTAVLKGHGFQDIVVCPGSRNGILVHNFNAAHFHLHPVTDERSAAFVALGLCLSTQRPVAICVTSGSALLNTIPAVAEASFRHLPLLIISADRPKQWIGQLDGQTLSQNGALQPYAPTLTIEEAHTAEEEHWNVLRMNEAILALQHQGGQPVHLNVPITEPLFSFETAHLPEVNIIQEERPSAEHPLSPSLMEKISAAKCPILVMGQYEKGEIDGLKAINDHGTLLVLPEIVSGQNYSWRTTALEHLLPQYDFLPDLVVHIGGNLVNKQLKLYLRKLPHCEVIRIEEGDIMPDTFGHLHTIVRASSEAVVKQLSEFPKENQQVREYQKQLDLFCNKEMNYSPIRFSDLGVMKIVREQLTPNCALQVANSSVIRNAAYYFAPYASHLFCNRGVNGIEGSLSAAVGYALGHSDITLSLIGDLSFFYDQSALWNKELPQNLRIILFNNGGGQIFYRLPGLSQTPALAPYIAAAHTTHAKGLAECYGLTYLEAHDYPQVTHAVKELLSKESCGPMLLEVFTHTEDNETELKQIKQYYKTL